MEKQIYRPVERRVFMGEKHRFFDSIEGEDERQYTADEFAEYFRQFIRNGIFPGGENLKVETNEQDMKVFINPGYAWIEGYLYKIDTEPLVMEHKIADPSLNRIDRVVVRLDKTLENRYVKVFILEGTPAETPQVPELTRDNNIYEISLAQIEIIAGKSFIEAYQITDERLNNDVCGIATHLFEQVDTTDIFNEWMNYLDHKREEANLSYDAFVNAYQTTWNNWIEEKISEPGGEFYAEWKDWFNELQDTTNLVTKSQFDGFKNTKGAPGGLASLDENVQVPTEQLENVQYLKDFYGRSVIRCRALDVMPDYYYHSMINNGIGGFKLIRDFLKNHIQSGSNFENGFNFTDIDFSIVSSYRINASANVSLLDGFISLYASGGSGTADITIASNEPYDLTNVSEILVDVSASGSNTFKCYVGVQSVENYNTIYARYDKSWSTSSNFSRQFVSIDVSDLSGPHYIKMAARDDDSSAHAIARLNVYEIELVGDFELHYDVDEKEIRLEGILSREFECPQFKIPPHFLDWYSFNALVTTPPNTSVRFDILDENDELLREDIGQGEVLRLTHPIIRPKVVLSRESLLDPSPGFRWLEIGYRGSATGLWQKLDEVTLDTNVQQIDIQIPEGFNEFRITGRELSTVISTSSLMMTFDDETSGYNYNFVYGKDSGSSSANTTRIAVGSSLLRNSTKSYFECIIGGMGEGSYPYGHYFTSLATTATGCVGMFSRNNDSQVYTINLFSYDSVIAAGATFEIWGR
jgi:hypothetical protein